MESRVNYTIVGFFVVTFLGLLGWFFYWLSHYGNEKRYDYYKIYSSESVAGLNVESAVKYKGLLVGTVYSMGINPSNSSEIEIVIQIEKGTPIKDDTRATVTPQGITGLSFIDLIGSSKESQRLNTSKDAMASIQTYPSMFTRVESKFNDISEQMQTLLIKFNHLLDDNNIENFSLLLEQSALSARQIKILLDEQRFAEIDTVLENIKDITMAIKEQTPKFDKLVKSAGGTLEGFGKNSTQLQALLENIERRLNNGEFNLKHISLSAFDSLHSLSSELHSLSIKTKESLNRLENSPSDLLFKSNEIPAGPGEE